MDFRASRPIFRIDINTGDGTWTVTMSVARADALWPMAR